MGLSLQFNLISSYSLFFENIVAIKRGAIKSQFLSLHCGCRVQFTNKKARHYVNVNKTTATALFLSFCHRDEITLCTHKK